MISKYFLFSLFFFALAFIGVECSLYLIFIFCSIVLGFFLHLLLNKNRWIRTNPIFDRLPTSSVKRRLNERIFDGENETRPKDERETLTGNEEIDQPIHEFVELFVRDYVEIWYKKRISSDENFIREVKKSIYIVIRHLSSRLKEIDWLDFCTGTLVDNFARHVRLYRKAKEKVEMNPSSDVCEAFFDFEAEFERGICRDEVCLDPEKEKEFIRDLVEVLLYIVLPANDFRCVPAEKLLRELIVNFGFIRFIEIYSDPDVVNQLIISMCQQIPLTIDNFLLVVRTIDSKKELLALKERLDVETSRWRSHDIGGENDRDVRATLSSYQFLKRLIEDRIENHFDAEGKLNDEDDAPARNSFREISFSQLLRNPNGVDHFQNFLKKIDAGDLLDFLLIVQSFQFIKSEKFDEDSFRAAAADVIDRFLLPTSQKNLSIDEALLNKTRDSFRSGNFDETLFDEIHGKIVEILSSDKYFGLFKASNEFVKFLNEIDLTDSMNDGSDTNSVSSNNSNDLFLDSIESPSIVSAQPKQTDAMEYFDNFTIKAEITSSVLCPGKRGQYALYMIQVSCKPSSPNNEPKDREWMIFRRYSEFNDLYLTIKQRFPTLKDLFAFPTKNFVDNTSGEVREKRKRELNNYLNALLAPKVFQENPQICDLLWKFLRSESWVHEQSDFARKVDTLTNPFKQAATGIAKGVTMIGNAGKVLLTNSKDTSTRFALVEENSIENSKNIPLRVLLVIMDEVFDLKKKNMWFRSRFVSILKGFLTTFMGNSVNRRISMFVQHWTSPKKIAKEIRRFKENLWPNDVQAEPNGERDENVRCVTEILCKSKLLGIVSDELRHIIGSRTTRRSLLRLFELLQNRTLNRRFVLVVLESLLIKLFRPNELNLIFDQLYSRSSRVPEHFRQIISNKTDRDKHPKPQYFHRLSVRNDDENFCPTSRR